MQQLKKICQHVQITIVLLKLILVSMLVKVVVVVVETTILINIVMRRQKIKVTKEKIQKKFVSIVIMMLITI